MFLHMSTVRCLKNKISKHSVLNLGLQDQRLRIAVPYGPTKYVPRNHTEENRYTCRNVDLRFFFCQLLCFANSVCINIIIVKSFLQVKETTTISIFSRFYFQKHFLLNRCKYRIYIYIYTIYIRYIYIYTYVYRDKWRSYILHIHKHPHVIALHICSDFVLNILDKL
jgi:hypothetical protein